MRLQVKEQRILQADTSCNEELEDVDPSVPDSTDQWASINSNQFEFECADALLHNPPDNIGNFEEEEEDAALMM